MWRDDALMDLRGVPAIEAEAVRLENRRLSVYEDWFEAELDIGNHAHGVACDLVFLAALVLVVRRINGALP